MNTTLFCALKGTIDGADDLQVPRFIASQTIYDNAEDSGLLCRVFRHQKMMRHWPKKPARTGR